MEMKRMRSLVLSLVFLFTACLPVGFAEDLGGAAIEPEVAVVAEAPVETEPEVAEAPVYL